MATQQDKTSWTDVRLVKAAQRGDSVAFEELVARHRDKVFARAFSMMRNEESAVDLSQEAWVKGWQRLKQFQGTIVFISHDVYFIKAIANHVVHVKSGQLTHYPGGYQYYLDKTKCNT